VRPASVAHPLLFAVFPLLSLFAQNQTDIELNVLWWPLVLCLLAAAIVFAVCFAATREPLEAGALASVVVISFFYFGLFSDRVSSTLSTGVQLTLWLVATAVLLVVIARTSRSLGPLTLILTVMALVLALPRAIDIATYHSKQRAVSARDPRLWPSKLAPPSPAAGKRLPDIYVLVPDDYARTDVLRRYFHYGDHAFMAALRKRGFAISPQARSPYSDSESNIAAELNLDYLSSFPRVLGKSSQDVRTINRVEEDNRAARLLATAGYRYEHLDTDEVTFAGGNPGISSLAPPDSFVNLWMRKTILGPIGGPIGFNRAATDARFRTSINKVFSQLAAAPSKPGRKFVVFHTLLPHDPYVYGANGQQVTFPSKNEDDLGAKAGARYYLEQLKYTSKRLLSSIDAILAHSRRPPVIVLQADEGFQANPDYLGERDAQDIRVKGIVAVHLPGARPDVVPEPPTTINTLRFVFNRYLGTSYPMLRAASYPEADLPYDFQEMRVK
jgi:hypothetical protein